MQNSKLMSDELAYIKYASRNFQENPVLLDIGMNEGVFSQEFLGMFPNSIIYGFEPIKESVGKASDKFRELLFKKVFIYNFLLSSGIEIDSRIYSRKECSSIFIRERFPGKSVIVPSLFLDLFFHVFPEKIDYMKIDVEGSELYVLEGAEILLLCKRIKYIQFEINDEENFGNENLETITNCLKQYGYIVRNPKLEIVTDFAIENHHDVRNFLAELIS
jgi:FkbM family methyltransferase